MEFVKAHPEAAPRRRAGVDVDILQAPAVLNLKRGKRCVCGVCVAVAVESLTVETIIVSLIVGTSDA